MFPWRYLCGQLREIKQSLVGVVYLKYYLIDNNQ